MLDRLYWLLNRKPSKNKSNAYLSSALCYFIYGMIITVGVEFLFAGYTKPIIIGAILIMLSVSASIMVYVSDKKGGYVDAHYQAYLAQRERIRKKLGKL